jgi:hypothetical protein
MLAAEPCQRIVFRTPVAFRRLPLRAHSIGYRDKRTSLHLAGQDAHQRDTDLRCLREWFDNLCK